MKKCTKCTKLTLENAEGAIKIGQSRETDNIGYTRHKTKTSKAKTQYVLDTTILKQTHIFVSFSLCDIGYGFTSDFPEGFRFIVLI